MKFLFCLILGTTLALGYPTRTWAQDPTEESETEANEPDSEIEGHEFSSEGVDSSPEGTAATETATQTSQKTESQPKVRRRYRREKKAEGSKARERFQEAITAIRSRYKYKGRTLYVDPD